MDVNSGNPAGTPPSFTFGAKLNSITARPHCPATSFPNELLVMVFRELMRPPYRADIEDSFVPFDTTLRSVCRLWLRVIDNTPALWTCLVLSSPVVDYARLRAVLQQSKSAPLDLAVVLKAMTSQLLCALQPEIKRVRSLKLECASANAPRGMNDAAWLPETVDLRHLMLQLVRCPAPLLQELVIDSDHSTLPTDIFSSATPPPLQILVITCREFVTLSSCIFKSTQLTTLKIRSDILWHSVDELFALLGSLSKLQYFNWDVKTQLDQWYDCDSFARKFVRLPELQEMDLHLPIDMAALLVTALDFPGKTKLAIECWAVAIVDPPVMDSCMAAFKSALDEHLQSLFPDSSDGYTNIRFCESLRDNTDRMFVVTMNHHDDESYTAPIPTFTLGMQCEMHAREEYAEFVAWVFGLHGAAANVRQIDADSLRYGLLDHPYQWTSLLGLFPRVREVHVGGRCAAAFFRALCANAVPLSPFARALETVLVKDAGAWIAALIVEALDARVEARLPKLELRLWKHEIEAPMLQLLVRHEGVRGVLG